MKRTHVPLCNRPVSLQYFAEAHLFILLHAALGLTGFALHDEPLSCRHTHVRLAKKDDALIFS